MAARAQTPPQTGAPPFRYTDHLATVEVYSANANLSVTIPIFTKPSRGPRPRVALIYNSNNYIVLNGGFYENLDIMGDPWVMDPNPGGRLYYDTQTMAQGGGACTWYIYSGFRYYDQSGTMHPSSGWVSTNATADGRRCHTGMTSMTSTASDGSGYVLRGARRGKPRPGSCGGRRARRITGGPIGAGLCRRLGGPVHPVMGRHGGPSLP